jgi:hypothetical protein
MHLQSLVWFSLVDLRLKIRLETALYANDARQTDRQERKVRKALAFTFLGSGNARRSLVVVGRTVVGGQLPRFVCAPRRTAARASRPHGWQKRPESGPMMGQPARTRPLALA